VRSDRHGREQSNELTEGMPMAGGGGSMLARGEEVTAFIAGREAVGRYLRIKAARGGGVVVWDAAWPGYGVRGGNVRVAIGQWQCMGGAAWPVCKQHVAPSRGPTRVTHRD
jgi:hypothetical protein